MQCPVCKDKALVMADRQGIEIDYCPQCRGVWLDRGELDKIIERSAVIEERARIVETPGDGQRAAAGRDFNAEFRPQPRKRKSLLSDLLDFD